MLGPVLLCVHTVSIFLKASQWYISVEGVSPLPDACVGAPLPKLNIFVYLIYWVLPQRPDTACTFIPGTAPMTIFYHVWCLCILSWLLRLYVSQLGLYLWSALVCDRWRFTTVELWKERRFAGRASRSQSWQALPGQLPVVPCLPKWGGSIPTGRSVTWKVGRFACWDWIAQYRPAQNHFILQLYKL